MSSEPDDESDEAVRDHSAFLDGYAPEDEGLYDDFEPHEQEKTLPVDKR